MIPVMNIGFALAMGFIAGLLTTWSAGATVSVAVWLLLLMARQVFREE